MSEKTPGGNLVVRKATPNSQILSQGSYVDAKRDVKCHQNDVSNNGVHMEMDSKADKKLWVVLSDRPLVFNTSTGAPLNDINYQNFKTNGVQQVAVNLNGKLQVLRAYL